MQPTFNVVKLEPWHLSMIDLQDKQQYFATKAADPAFRIAVANQGGYAGLLDFGPDKAPVVTGCCGIAPIDTGVGIAWAVLSKSFPRYAVRYTRFIKNYLQEQLATDFHRIEAEVNVSFLEAKRWVEMLGFEYEFTKRQADAYRQDVMVYAMIREKEA